MGAGFQLPQQTQRRLWFVVLMAALSFSMRLTHVYDPLCRALTEVLIYGCTWMNVELFQNSPTSFIMANQLTVVVDPLCTAIPSYLLSVPFLYLIGESRTRFVGRIATFFVVMSVVNAARLIVGLWAYDRGTSWLVSHEIAYGIFYAIWAIYILSLHKLKVPRTHQLAI